MKKVEARFLINLWWAVTIFRLLDLSLERWDLDIFIKIQYVITIQKDWH